MQIAYDDQMVVSITFPKFNEADASCYRRKMYVVSNAERTDEDEEETAPLNVTIDSRFNCRYYPTRIEERANIVSWPIIIVVERYC